MGHVDVVENAFRDQFGFAAEQLQFSRFDQAGDVRLVLAFFRWRGDKRQRTRQLRQNFRPCQHFRAAKHGVQRRMMAAGMRRMGRRVRKRMLRNDQRIQFPQNGDTRARTPRIDVRPPPRDGQSCLFRQT